MVGPNPHDLRLRNIGVAYGAGYCYISLPTQYLCHTLNFVIKQHKLLLLEYTNVSTEMVHLIKNKRFVL